MKSRVPFVAGLAAVFLAGSALAAAALKSGPQVGESVPGPFEPLNVTGAQAGQKFCQYCKNGVRNPMMSLR